MTTEMTASPGTIKKTLQKNPKTWTGVITSLVTMLLGTGVLSQFGLWAPPEGTQIYVETNGKWILTEPQDLPDKARIVAITWGDDGKVAGLRVTNVSLTGNGNSQPTPPPTFPPTAEPNIPPPQKDSGNPFEE